MLNLYNYRALGNNPSALFPTYVQQNPMYGASPVAGSYGWWGKNSNGASTGMYAPALYYQPVMDRLIALVQAMGQHLDGDPYVEGFFIGEDSPVVQAAVGSGSVDPHYSDDAWLTQLERLLTASTAAFPHTNVIMANSFFGYPPATVALEQWMAANRIAASGSDSFGQSAINTYGTSIMGWGLDTYLGVPQYGGTDLRSKMTAMMDVQEPEMDGSQLGQYGAPYTPIDIINALNQTYHASHAFWTYLGGSAPPAAHWPAVAAACAANPLIRTGYPANYP